MRRLSGLFFLLVLLPLSIFAEVRQIPFDEGGKIMTITPKEEKELNLFEDYIGFQQANIYETDEGYLLEISYREGGAVYKDRKEFSSEEGKLYLQSVREKIRQSKVFSLDQTGRPIFLAGTTSYSVSFYGFAIPSILGIQNIPFVAPGLQMLIGATGFIFPYFWSQDKNVTLPQSILSVSAGGYGLAHGFLTTVIIHGTNDINQRLFFTLTTAASLSELIGGYALAGKYDMTEGETLLFHIGGGYGLAMGFGTSILSGFFDFDNVQPANPRLQATPPLLESFLGYGLAYAMNKQYPYSVGDVEVFWSMGEIGSQLAFTVFTYIPTDLDIEYEKLVAALFMTGSFSGYASAHYLMLNDKNFSVDQGALIYLWKNAGNLVGLGLGYLLSIPVPEEYHAKFYATTSFISSTAFFAYFYHQFSEKAQAQSLEEVDVKNLWSIKTDVMPLLSYMNSDMIQPGSGSSPILEVSYRF